MIFYTNDYRGFTDLNIVQFGFRECEPGFAPEYHIRSTYLVHYVYSGSGTLEADGVVFPVHENQAFMIFPGQRTTYTASENDPMVYRWIEFYGNKAEEILKASALTPQSPIFTDSSGLPAGLALKNLVDGGITDPFSLIGKFYVFAGSLCKNTTSSSYTNRYVDMAINYIHYRDNVKISVSEIAAYLNISSSLLTHIFTEKTGVPPKKYILKYFMENAVTMLKNGRLSINEISYSLGYNSTEEFSKAFKRYFNVSPTAYRKSHALDASKE